MRLLRALFACLLSILAVLTSASAQVPGSAPIVRSLDTEFVGRGARRLDIGPHRFSMVGALPKLEVEIKNPTRRERRYEYKIEWSDGFGSRAQTTSQWRALFLGPGESQRLVSVGQVTHAVNAKLTLRETAAVPKKDAE